MRQLLGYGLDSNDQFHAVKVCRYFLRLEAQRCAPQLILRWTAARVLTGMHHMLLPAGVEPTPIGGPPCGQQGARAVECPGSALRALTPLRYSRSVPMATRADTRPMGAVRGAANPLRRRESASARLGYATLCWRTTSLTRKHDSESDAAALGRRPSLRRTGSPTRRGPRISWRQTRTRPGSSENRDEENLPLGGAGVLESRSPSGLNKVESNNWTPRPLALRSARSGKSRGVLWASPVRVQLRVLIWQVTHRYNT